MRRYDVKPFNTGHLWEPVYNTPDFLRGLLNGALSISSTPWTRREQRNERG
jgi:hypothetical protein